MEVECIEDGHKLVELDARRTPGLETSWRDTPALSASSPWVRPAFSRAARMA